MQNGERVAYPPQFLSFFVSSMTFNDARMFDKTVFIHAEVEGPNNQNFGYRIRAVAPKLFECADHLKQFGGPQSTKY